MKMRERMARAMMDNELGDGSFDEAAWRGAEAERQVWLSHADAALDAMREPTEAMCDAGVDRIDANTRCDVSNSWLSVDVEIDDEAPQECWQAMIDAARNEEQE